MISTHTVSSSVVNDSYGYTYDGNGNITEITKGGVIQQSYVYDDNSQLIRENNLDLNKSIVYAYDNSGNILSKTEYAFTTGELGTATDTISYTYDSTWKDKLTSYDGEAIIYDAIGNPTSYRGATLTWNGRQLASYTKGDLTITYKYDANGLRTQKTVNGVVYDYGYEDGKLVYECKGDEYEVIYRYDADGNLFTVNRCILSSGYTSLLYAVNNTRGDVVALYKGGGGIYSTYTYDSWGKPIVEATEMSAENSIRYRGYVYDQETGLYYLQSRYYDPETGRFLNADDVDYIGYSGEDISYNAFAYCENEPVCHIDVSGYTSNHIFADKVFAIFMLNYLYAFLTDYLLLNNSLIYIKEYDRDEFGICNATVEYNDKKNRDFSFCVCYGGKVSWESKCIWGNNLDIKSSTILADRFVAAETEEELTVLLDLIIAFVLIFEASYKKNMATKGYSYIWGTNGIDKEEQNGYLLYWVREQKEINGLYAYSSSMNNGKEIV